MGAGSKLTFTNLLKESKKQLNLLPHRLAVVGDSSTQHLAAAIKGYGCLRGIRIEIFDADFRQQHAQIMDENSELFQFDPGYVLLYVSPDTLYEEYRMCDREGRANFAKEKLEQYTQYWHCLSEKKVKVLQNTIAEFTDSLYGSASAKREESFIFQLRKLNYLISETAVSDRNMYLVDFLSLQAGIGRERFFDEKMYIMGKLTISVAVLPLAAKAVVDVIAAISGMLTKCVILDLDNTLWGGVIGDDGIEKIQIGELGIGKAFSDFQSWLKELKKRGILLAVVSKNQEDIAKEPFICHPDMILKLDDFVMFVANWDNKADNILQIQKTLNIGVDSIVFIDDNPFERDQVRKTIEGINVPEMPTDPCEYVSYLRKQNLFEAVSASEEDSSRTQQYQEEVKRKSSEAQFKSYGEYLDSLNMTASVKCFDVFHIPRIAQLSQRSNQFNFRTVRLSEDDVAQIIEDKNMIGKYFELRDKYGGYGLIGYIVLKKESDLIFIDNWVMSCRILKRTMEEFIINEIFETAKSDHIKTIVGQYLPTKKNLMLKDFFGAFGFSAMKDNKWSQTVDAFEPFKTYITKEE